MGEYKLIFCAKSFLVERPGGRVAPDEQQPRPSDAVPASAPVPSSVAVLQTTTQVTE